MESAPEDRVLMAGAIVFDATTFELWGALLNGCTLYVIDKDTLINPKAFGEVLVNNDISIVLLTSALFTLMAEFNSTIFGK